MKSVSFRFSAWSSAIKSSGASILGAGPIHSMQPQVNRVNERGQLCFIELSPRAHSRANIDSKRLHLIDRLSHVGRVQPAREKQRNSDRIANTPAQRPIMHLSL